MHKKKKVYCNKCEFFRYHDSDWGEHNVCARYVIIEDTPIRKEEHDAECDQINILNTCPTFTPALPRPFFWRMFGVYRDVTPIKLDKVAYDSTYRQRKILKLRAAAERRKHDNLADGC